MSNPIPCGDDFDVCPFCGVRPTIEPWHGGAKTKRMVACSNEDCDVQPQVTGETDLLARDKWNRRAPSPHSEDFPDMRDQFAMAAMSGLCSLVDDRTCSGTPEQIKAQSAGYLLNDAKTAYAYADAMIKARATSTPEGGSK